MVKCNKVSNQFHWYSAVWFQLISNSNLYAIEEGKQLATSRDCKFIETSSGIQHNVDELLVGVLKQIRLKESRDKKLRRQGSKGKLLSKLHNSKTVLNLNLARDILNKMCLNDSKSKSCENLHVLWKIAVSEYGV